MSSTKANNLFWLEYAEAIKQAAGIDFGPTGAFFLASEAQKGPLAGVSVPEEYTNLGLYQLGNNLLSVDNLFYNTSGLHGYAEAVKTYLSFVDLQKKGSEGLWTALKIARDNLEAAQARSETELTKSQAKFKKEAELGLQPSGSSFPAWVAQGNAPAYNAAKGNENACAEAVSEIEAQINGEVAASLNDDKAKINMALNRVIPTPGFNMKVAYGSTLTSGELVRMKDLGKEIPAPTTTMAPAYNAPSYRDLVVSAENRIGTNFDPTKFRSLDVKINLGKKTEDYHNGQTEGSGSGSVTFGPWFSFNASASHEKEDSSIDTGSESESVTIKIIYDKLQKINVDLGQWNVDVSKYKLREGAPAEVKTLARVTSFVVATGLGYEVSVGADTAKKIDTHYSEATKAQGSLSVFGLPINLSGSGSSSKVENSHKAEWDSATRTFKVIPTFETGYATVLGVVAEKFNIRTA